VIKKQITALKASQKNDEGEISPSSFFCLFHLNPKSQTSTLQTPCKQKKRESTITD